MYSATEEDVDDDGVGTTYSSTENDEEVGIGTMYSSASEDVDGDAVGTMYSASEDDDVGTMYSTSDEEEDVTVGATAYSSTDADEDNVVGLLAPDGDGSEHGSLVTPGNEQSAIGVFGQISLQFKNARGQSTPTREKQRKKRRTVRTVNIACAETRTRANCVAGIPLCGPDRGATLRCSRRWTW